MATKSILKNITIKDPKSASMLASALENASGKHSKEVTYARGVRKATKQDIKKIFGDK